MPKVTLEYSLPEEREEYETAMRAGNYSQALWEYDTEFLRANIKHGIQEDTVSEVMQELTNYLQHEGINISRETVAIIAEATLQVARTRLYRVMNECNGNPFE